MSTLHACRLYAQVVRVSCFKMIPTIPRRPCPYHMKVLSMAISVHIIIIIIIRQPLCPVVGRRPQHAVSKLPCLVLSSAISCRSSICLGRLSTAWLVSLVVFSCHNYGLEVVTREVHRSSLRRLICPAQDHFIFLTVLIISMTFVLSLTQMLVFLLCDVEHTSFHFGLCGCTFVLCLFGQCPVSKFIHSKPSGFNDTIASTKTSTYTFMRHKQLSVSHLSNTNTGVL